jgi:hypothetical protein
VVSVFGEYVHLISLEAGEVRQVAFFSLPSGLQGFAQPGSKRRGGDHAAGDQEGH